MKQIWIGKYINVRFGWYGFWWEWWTPAYARGRGPYISIGLGLVAIYRGY